MSSQDEMPRLELAHAEPMAHSTPRKKKGWVVKAFMWLLVLAGGAVFGLYQMRVEIPGVNTAKIYAHLDEFAEKAMKAKEYVVERVQPHHEEESHHEAHKIVVTSPKAKPVTLTQQFVSQIHSQRHINIKAIDTCYLEEILVKEGQAVKKGDLMFKIVPVLYQARLDVELAEAQLAQLNFNNSKRLLDQKVISENEVNLRGAELAKAQAKAKLAGAELNFTNVVAPFDGIVDRLQEQLGSLIKEGDVLTTLSDNSVMWVYFNVPEKQYLEYMADLDKNKADRKIELLLADGNKFDQPGKISAIEAKFNNENGNLAFRADFPNPKGLLRHGQTGNVMIHRVQEGAIVIPQRAIFEILDKRYVYVVGKDDVVRQREVSVQNEMDDIYVIKKGLSVEDKVVLEGGRQIRDGDKVEYEFRQPERVMANLKNRAE